MSETKIKDQPKDNHQLTPADARAVLQAEIARRQQACVEEINAVLQKYNCEIVVIRAWSDDGRLMTRPEVRAAG